MKRLDWYIARRYLASRRRGRFLSLITVIAVGGVLLGVMALITVIAVMTGLQRDLQEKILGTNPHIFVFEQGQGFRMGQWPAVFGRVKGLPGVVAAEPFIMTQVGVTAGSDYAQPGTLYGIDATASRVPMTTIEAQLRSGKLSLRSTHSGLPGVLVGRKLADKLGLLAGDTVTMASFESIKRGPLGDIVPRLRQFEVTGLFTTGMYEYDTQNLYASIPAVQDLLGIGPDTVSGIAVNVRDPWHASVVGDTISRHLGFPYWTTDWMTLNQSLFSALKLEKLAMGVILFLIVLVAAFNIITQLIMVVTDKTREIGILKSMGMTDATVLRIFMLQGLAIGVIGTLLGAVGGLGLVWLLGKYHFISLPGDVYFIDTLPVALEPLDVLSIVGLSILVAFAATIYPARQASRLLPVEAIRHE
ncbi:MAG TPA: FtsX-like permease family protein [Longimicrobiales bacterium]|nr:FtsX-like permease family protein [Longimicrobiales bacterium]